MKKFNGAGASSFHDMNAVATLQFFWKDAVHVDSNVDTAPVSAYVGKEHNLMVKTDPSSISQALHPSMCAQLDARVYERRFLLSAVNDGLLLFNPSLQLLRQVLTGASTVVVIVTGRYDAGNRHATDHELLARTYSAANGHAHDDEPLPANHKFHVGTMEDFPELVEPMCLFAGRTSVLFCNLFLQVAPRELQRLLDNLQQIYAHSDLHWFGQIGHFSARPDVTVIPEGLVQRADDELVVRYIDLLSQAPVFTRGLANTHSLVARTSFRLGRDVFSNGIIKSTPTLTFGKIVRPNAPVVDTIHECCSTVYFSLDGQSYVCDRRTVEACRGLAINEALPEEKQKENLMISLRLKVAVLHVLKSTSAPTMDTNTHHRSMLVEAVIREHRALSRVPRQGLIPKWFRSFYLRRSKYTLWALVGSFATLPVALSSVRAKGRWRPILGLMTKCFAFFSGLLAFLTWLKPGARRPRQFSLAYLLYSIGYHCAENPFEPAPARILHPEPLAPRNVINFFREHLLGDSPGMQCVYNTLRSAGFEIGKRSHLHVALNWVDFSALLAEIHSVSGVSFVVTFTGFQAALAPELFGNSHAPIVLNLSPSARRGQSAINHIQHVSGGAGQLDIGKQLTRFLRSRRCLRTFLDCVWPSFESPTGYREHATNGTVANGVYTNGGMSYIAHHGPVLKASMVEMVLQFRNYKEPNGRPPPVFPGLTAGADTLFTETLNAQHLFSLRLRYLEVCGHPKIQAAIAARLKLARGPKRSYSAFKLMGPAGSGKSTWITKHLPADGKSGSVLVVTQTRSQSETWRKRGYKAATFEKASAFASFDHIVVEEALLSGKSGLHLLPEGSFYWLLTDAVQIKNPDFARAEGLQHDFFNAVCSLRGYIFERSYRLSPATSFVVTNLSGVETISAGVNLGGFFLVAADLLQMRDHARGQVITVTNAGAGFLTAEVEGCRHQPNTTTAHRVIGEEYPEGVTVCVFADEIHPLQYCGLEGSDGEVVGFAMAHLVTALTRAGGSDCSHTYLMAPESVIPVLAHLTGVEPTTWADFMLHCAEETRLGMIGAVHGPDPLLATATYDTVNFRGESAHCGGGLPAMPYMQLNAGTVVEGIDFGAIRRAPVELQNYPVRAFTRTDLEDFRLHFADFFGASTVEGHRFASYTTVDVDSVDGSAQLQMAIDYDRPNKPRVFKCMFNSEIVQLQSASDVGQMVAIAVSRYASSGETMKGILNKTGLLRAAVSSSCQEILGEVFPPVDREFDLDVYGMSITYTVGYLLTQSKKAGGLRRLSTHMDNENIAGRLDKDVLSCLSLLQMVPKTQAKAVTNIPRTTPGEFEKRLTKGGQPVTTTSDSLRTSIGGLLVFVAGELVTQFCGENYCFPGMGGSTHSDAHRAAHSGPTAFTSDTPTQSTDTTAMDTSHFEEELVGVAIIFDDLGSRCGLQGFGSLLAEHIRDNQKEWRSGSAPGARVKIKATVKWMLASGQSWTLFLNSIRNMMDHFLVFKGDRTFGMFTGDDNASGGHLVYSPMFSLLTGIKYKTMHAHGVYEFCGAYGIAGEDFLAQDLVRIFNKFMSAPLPVIRRDFIKRVGEIQTAFSDLVKPDWRIRAVTVAANQRMRGGDLHFFERLYDACLSLSLTHADVWWEFASTVIVHPTSETWSAGAYF